MLKNLRLRLTLLYLFVAMLLVVLLGSSTYSVLFFYFQNANDTALHTKMALVLDALGAQVPADFEIDNKFGIGVRGTDDDEEHAGDREEDENDFQNAEEIYEGELSSVFVLPLSASGDLLFNPNPYTLPMQPNLEALDTALIEKIDYRNGSLDDGTPARLLTYAVPALTGIEVIQVGKSILDQVRILNQFLTSLLIIGGVSIIVLGVGSWWMAGRFLDSHERAWENQQAFIANASHELRTPLTLIRASAEAAIRRSKKDTSFNLLLNDVISETDHMCNLVQDLLLLTRLDAGELKLTFTKINLSILLSNIERQFKRLADDIQIEFNVKINNVYCTSDATRLRQILLILLDNAFQHTPAGGKVTLSASMGNNEIEFQIVDTGEGIPQNHLALIFDRFYQVEPDRGGENHGSGLGLSIAKSLTEALGGRIEIRSETDKGTTAVFYLPC